MQSTSPTVLVVEDNDVVSDFLEGALRAYGYRVLLAATPDQAVEQCRHESSAICALIADVRLGGRDGFKTACMLMPIHPEMKVIFTSGYPFEHLVRDGLLPADLQKTMFLQKPFLPSEIKSLLSILVRPA